MNLPDGNVNFVPKQALSPTPELYDELVSDSMENLAKASLAHIPAIPNGAIIHDNGCGTGAATIAIVASLPDPSMKVSIKGTDVNDQALDIYRKRAAEYKWPAEAERMDSNSLSFPDSTFTHTVGNAMLFVLANDGIDAVKEMHRTLEPGGRAIVNSWAYVPNMEPLEAAARATRPAGTPLPRAGLEKWARADFLQGVVEKGGFHKDKITVTKSDVYVTISDINHYSTMLWSFIGGTTPVGWLKSDEENWDEAVNIIKQEVRKTSGYKELEGGKSLLKFVANIAIATK